MRRQDPDDPAIFWYEIVEVYYGSDRRPMMWNEATLPYVDSNDVMFQNEEIEVTGKVTSAKLKSAFLKMNKGKQVHRVLVSKFIEKIAA